EIAEPAYLAMGYRVLGKRVLRVDRVERLAAAARRQSRHGPFAATPELATLAICPQADLAAMLTALGYRAVHDKAGVTFHRRRTKRPARGPKRGRAERPRRPADSPFAKLKQLRLAQ